ncbi:MAG: KH domain-containing protein [Candidatus Aenigmatarchaeota archaeon]
MKICKVCLQSNILCLACNRKLEQGEIKEIEVKLSRELHKINMERDMSLDFVSIVENDNKLFVVVDSKHAARFIGPGGKNIKKLSHDLGKQVKLLEKAEGSDKHVIEKLIGAPIIGINKIYSGIESYKVRVEKRYMKNVQPLADVVGKIIGKKVSFVFE